MSNLPRKRDSDAEILIYQTEDQQTRIRVLLDGQTVWLSQKQMAELFQTSVPNINMHVGNVFNEGELEEDSVVKEYLITAADGKAYRTKVYNLDVIISVGYRVRSHRGTQFRIWATQRLREYLIKGFTMDDERLKEGRSLGTDYFDELLERIRDIRASEKRFYQKVRDIYSLSVDYDPNAETTREFFQIVQNKLHWAITGHTAAELIAGRADAARPNMGLTSWKGAKVRQADVLVAKNYLNAEELDQLNRAVTMWLDYAEDQARRRRPVHMRDWRKKLDMFLQFNDRAILERAGGISMQEAHRLALEQYELFSRRRIQSEDAAAEEEFEREVKKFAPQPEKERE